MEKSDLKLAASLFERALELEGYAKHRMEVGEGKTVDFVSAVAGEQGGLASLMMASDRLSVMQYGVRLWNCGYVHSNESGDGMGVRALEDFTSREAAASYRAIDRLNPQQEVGLALMIARDTVSQLCEKRDDQVARLNPVPGFFFNLESAEASPEIPFESVSDIVAFGWRQMMVANRELVLSLGHEVTMDQEPAAPTSPARP